MIVGVDVTVPVEVAVRVFVGVGVTVGVPVCVIVGVMVAVGVNFTHKPVTRLQDASVTNVPPMHPPLEQLFEVPISTQAGTPHPSQQFTVVVESAAVEIRAGSRENASSAKKAAIVPPVCLITSLPVRFMTPPILANHHPSPPGRPVYTQPLTCGEPRKAARLKSICGQLSSTRARPFRRSEGAIALRGPRWHITP